MHFARLPTKQPRSWAPATPARLRVPEPHALTRAGLGSWLQDTRAAKTCPKVSDLCHRERSIVNLRLSMSMIIKFGLAALAAGAFSTLPSKAETKAYPNTSGRRIAV